VVSDEWLDNFLAGGPPISASSTAHDIQIPRPPAEAPPPEEAPPTEPAAAPSPRQELGGLETWDGKIPTGWLTEEDTGVSEPGQAEAESEEALPDWLAGAETPAPARPEQPRLRHQKKASCLTGYNRTSRCSSEKRHRTGSGRRSAAGLAGRAETPAPRAVAPAALKRTKAFLTGWRALRHPHRESGLSCRIESDELPDWLAGVETPASDRGAAPSTAEEEGELPDWLAGAESDEAPAAEQLREPEGKEEELPSTLAGMDESPAPERVTPPEPAVESAQPDWLAGAEAGTEDEEKALPDWLAGVENSPAGAEQRIDDSEAPDWLRMMEAGEGAEDQVELTAEREEPTPDQGLDTARQEDKPVAASDNPMGDDQNIPDWMLDGDLDSDDAIAWLEEIAAKYDPNFKGGEAGAETPAAEATEQPAAAEQPASTEAQEEDLSWLRSEPSPAAATPEPTAEAEEELPSWLTAEEEEKPAAAPVSAPAEEEALSWLDEQVAEQGVSPTGVVSEELKPDQPPVSAAPPPIDAMAEAASDEELPAWLRGEDVDAEIEKAMSRPETDDELAGLPELEAEDEELAWLTDTLKAEGGADGGLDLTEEEEEIPSWLKGEEEPAKAAAPSPVTAEEEELPEWLRSMEEEEAPEAAPALRRQRPRKKKRKNCPLDEGRGRRSACPGG
jgi:hypothetical protein